MVKDKDIIIIGAGISGLITANTLKNHMYNVTVLEQAPVVGGRLATQPMQRGLADYGAQFFTARTAVFQKQVDSWIEAELVYIWGHEWSDGSTKRTLPNGRPRYAVRGGMYQLAKHLSDEVPNLYMSTSVSNIQWADNHWEVTDNKGVIHTSRVLVLTPPVPQSLALLKDVDLNPTDYGELHRINYSTCVCGLFVVDGDTNLPSSGAIQDFTKPVYWVADNQKKGISGQQRVITMHLDKIYSQQYYNKPQAEVLKFLRDNLQQYLAPNAKIITEELKKWQYSVPLTTYPHDILAIDELPLIFAGDGFGGRGRVEGAYLSGLAAGKAANSFMQNKLSANKHLNQS